MRESMIRGLLAALLACLGLPTAACAGWVEVAPLPEPRWFHGAGLGADGRIYAFGGYVLPRGKRVRTYGLGRYALVAYESKANVWSRGPAPAPFRYTWRAPDFTREMAESRVRHDVPTGASHSDGRIYWFGGRGAIYFDPQANEWHQKPGPVWVQGENRFEGPNPFYARWNGTVASGPQGRLFLLGGIGGPILESDAPNRRLLRHAEAYDPETNAWSEIAPMQRARQLFAACFGPDGKLYVFGGYGHEGSITQRPRESDASFARRGDQMRALTPALDSVEVWDPATDSWSWREPMPQGVQTAGAALGADGRIYVIGGSLKFGNPKPVDRVQVYDPRADSWSEGPSLNVPRHGHAVVGTPEGRIYAIGGTNSRAVFHPRQIVGGGAGKEGEVLDSVEILETAPVGKTPEPEPAPPDRG